MLDNNGIENGNYYVIGLCRDYVGVYGQQL